MQLHPTAVTTVLQHHSDVVTFGRPPGTCSKKNVVISDMVGSCYSLGRTVLVKNIFSRSQKIGQEQAGRLAAWWPHFQRLCDPFWVLTHRLGNTNHLWFVHTIVVIPLSEHTEKRDRPLNQLHGEVFHNCP